MPRSWPEHFPAGCPPEESELATGRIYRFVSGEAPTHDDFVSLQLENPTNSYGRMACQACGLSVFRDWAVCLYSQKVVPALKKKKIAFGDLTPDHGAVMPTPSKMTERHHTWWLPDTVDAPEDLFIIAEDNG
ncbi:hypothetical protein [Salicola sp. Rm-C-2C1-2]|uniref:hypothetical protein n=1 Tax=Salicola sp. Rm-C-2C1-2 TaxID=3141321 RepID=UPI0032E4CB02